MILDDIVADKRIRLTEHKKQMERNSLRNGVMEHDFR